MKPITPITPGLVEYFITNDDIYDEILPQLCKDKNTDLIQSILYDPRVNGARALQVLAHHGYADMIVDYLRIKGTYPFMRKDLLYCVQIMLYTKHFKQAIYFMKQCKLYLHELTPEVICKAGNFRLFKRYVDKYGIHTSYIFRLTKNKLCVQYYIQNIIKKDRLDRFLQGGCGSMWQVKLLMQCGKLIPEPISDWQVTFHDPMFIRHLVRIFGLRQTKDTNLKQYRESELGFLDHLELRR